MIPPFPHDPVRYPEQPRYAGHESWLGRLRHFHSREFYAAVFDRDHHDHGDEDNR